MKHLIWGLIAWAFFVNGAAPACAGPISAVNFTGATSLPTGGDLSAGFSFTTNRPITIDALAAAFPLANGMNVRLYNALGTIFATANVLPTDPTDGTFNFHSITPVSLPIGTFYVAADLVGGQPSYFLATGLTTDPAIAFDGEVESAGLGTLPTSDAQGGVFNPGYFGPSFEIQSASSGVPEPSSSALLLIGAFGLLRHTWRRRRSIP